MHDAPVAQTPRRQRNGIYVNGSSVMRPASREGSAYRQDSSPAFAMPSLTRAQTAGAAIPEAGVKPRLPRQSTASVVSQHRLSRQSTRESMLGSARGSGSSEKDSRSQYGGHSSGGSTPISLTPLGESRARREERRAHGHSSSISQSRGGIGTGRPVNGTGNSDGQNQGRVEVTVASSARRTTARRGTNTDDRWN